MPKLKLSQVPDEKPIKLTVTLTAAQHELLISYAEAVAVEQGRAIEPARLVPLILERFITTDRAFARTRKIAVPLPASAGPKTEGGPNAPP